MCGFHITDSWCSTFLWRVVNGTFMVNEGGRCHRCGKRGRGSCPVWALVVDGAEVPGSASWLRWIREAGGRWRRWVGLKVEPLSPPVNGGGQPEQRDDWFGLRAWRGHVTLKSASVVCCLRCGRYGATKREPVGSRYRVPCSRRGCRGPSKVSCVRGLSTGRPFLRAPLHGCDSKSYC